MISKWLSASEIAEFLSATVRWIQKRSVTEHWTSRNEKANGGIRKTYQIAALPEDVQTAYAASLKLSLADLQSQLKPPAGHQKKINIPRYNGRGAKTKEIKPIDAAADTDLKIAALRAQLIRAYNDSGLSAAQFITAYENGVAVPELRERLGRWGNIHTQSNFYGWLASYERHGLAGLAPQYAKRHGGAGASLDERAKELIQGIYLDPRKPSIASVERDIKQFGYELNYTIINRYIKDEIPLSVKAFYRMGEKAYHDRFDPYIERDYTLFKAMEWGCADHHLFDFVITHEGRIFRPWLTAFIDMRSRKITGWHIDVVPNTLTIMRAFSMSVDTCGLFGNLLIDNGKDFKSHWFAGTAWKERRTRPEKDTLDLIEGVLHDCGTKAHFATPYRGQSKPIERFFRTVIELFSKQQEFYVGSNTATRPDDAKLYWGRINGRDRIEVTYTLAQLREDFGNFAAWFNSNWQHSGQGMDGRTPDEVFAANLEVQREMPEAMRKYVFAIREQRTVQRNGITIDGISYYNGELVRLIGSRVEVRRDINDVGKVAVFSLPGCIYQFDAVNEFFKDRGIAEENIRRVRNAQKKAREHLQDFAQSAAEVRRSKKTPAELLAEQARFRVIPGANSFKNLEVVGGEPLAVINRRRLRLPTDPD
ncbi:MAG: Mu transposase C-terminal domain-containing protein [Spirochaetaceae bacterium]|jgi:transposase InsO family protein|nr:Mu transposase C-terminal domain-containing protein [Spirochaetaceae bacterium]